ncbi:MAG: hypothetical protein JXB47_01445 [Anaerolineae bacterium]|nr:hypothetical protein [Anaerolineae bacterium]
MTAQTRQKILGIDRRWVIGAVALLALLYVAFIFLYRLGEYPLPRHDENDYLQVAKHFAFDGVYADFSAGEGYRYTGPVISVGPTVILPVALVYKLFGVGIPIARLTVVVYTFATLALLYAVSVDLVDARMAWVVLVLVIASETLDLQAYARAVIGEMPGLFFTLAGLWLWFRPGKRSLPALVGVGVLFSLASMTKNQYAVFVLPSMLLAWILDLFWYKRRGWLHFVVPGVVAGIIFFAWTYYAWFLLGAEARNVTEDVAALREAASSALFLINPGVNIFNFQQLMNGGVYGGLFVPGVILGLILGWRRDDEGQRWGMLMLFLLTSAALYIFSIGWPRLAVPPIALAAIPVARLLYGLTDGFRPDWEGLRALFQDREITLRTGVNLIVIGLLLGTVGLPLLRKVYNAVAEGSDDAYRAAEYIEENIPADALIETWAEELAVLTDHTYHYPPTATETHWVNHMWFEGPPTGEFYNFRDYADPDYVINSSFAREGHTYLPEALEGYELIVTIGEYDIYEKK